MTQSRGMRNLSFRTWLTIITMILLAGVIYFSWPEIINAWALLGQVDLWILSLLIPVQIISYYATGGIIFSYLRQKGNVRDMSHAAMTRLSLELNFVNHILPSGGAAGFSYLAWALRKYKVTVARATMAQIIRFTLTFVSFVMLLIIAIVMLTINHHIDRATVLVGVAITVAVVVVMVFVIWVLRDRKRLNRFSNWLERIMNKIVRLFTRGKRRYAVETSVLTDFFDDMHGDYLAIKRERRILIRPYIWAVVANALDAVLLWIAFASFGYYVDPALLFIAYGISSILGALSVTPGGAGVYETVMIAFLTTAGIPPGIAIAGTLLARVILVLGTIVFGYAFYQARISTYGDAPVIIEKE